MKDVSTSVCKGILILRHTNQVKKQLLQTENSFFFFNNLQLKVELF